MKKPIRTYHPPEQISHREPHSDFTWELRNDVLVIVDLDKGNMSVTNDIHRVWQYIREQIGTIAFDGLKAVIYRDSDGYFDEVRCISESRYFYSLARKVNGEMVRERNIKSAIKTALDKHEVFPLEQEPLLF